MFIAPQIFDHAHAVKASFGGNDSHYDPGAGPLFDNTKSYVMWALSGRQRALLPGDSVLAPGGEALKRIAQSTISGWHDLRNLVTITEPSTLSCLPIRTSVPVKPWATQRVTLLGDAIHSMTPFRGIGANIALRDAAALSGALSAANRDEEDVLRSIHTYETNMIRYGFRAVRESLKAMESTLDDRPFVRAVNRTAFKALEALPPINNWVFGHVGTSDNAALNQSAIVERIMV